MKNYANIAEIVINIESLSWNGALFVDPMAWHSNPQTASILLLEGDDELEDLADAQSHLPKLAFERGMKQLLDVQTLQDVIAVEQKQNPEACTESIIRAIEFYRKFDTYDSKSNP